MAVFLYDDIGAMLCSVMTRFIKKSELEAAKQVSDLAKIAVTSTAHARKWILGSQPERILLIVVEFSSMIRS